MGYQALLFCPDEKLARVVSQVFSELDFAIDPVSEPFAAVKKLMAQHYDAVVVDCDNEQNTALLFKSARNSSFNQGSLAIALVEGQAGVAKAYRIGANLVLTKPINVEQAKGTLRVARGLLRKNSEAAAAANPPASTTPAKVAPVPAAYLTQPSIQPAVQPANRSLELVAPPPTHTQSPEFEAPLPAAAASAVEEKPAAAPAPIAEIKTPFAAQAQAGNTLFAAEEARIELKKTENPKPAAAPVVSITSKSQGAASAPAPAKEVATPAVGTPAKKQAEAEKQEEIAEIESLAQPRAKVSTSAVSMPDGPSFAALGDMDADGSGGSKKILIAVAAVLAFAAAAYFGWTTFGQIHSNPTPQLVTTPPQKPSEPAPDARLTSTPAPSVGTTNRESAPVSAPAPKPSASAQSRKPTADASSTAHAGEAQIFISTESEAKNPASAPLVVKSGTTAAKPKARAEDPSVPVPSPLAVASPSDSGLNEVLSSASSDVAKPVLARIKLSQGVSQGLVIKRVPPKYPANALAAHIQGAVQIDATIDKEGKVVNPKVLKGDPTLAAAALEAVRQWRYKPYYLDGEPVEIQTQITINFKNQ